MRSQATEGTKMNIKELNGNAIKKALGVKRAMFRWHNKNKVGGNFGINVYGFKGLNCEFSGNYVEGGEIRSLRFGKIYECGVSVPHKNFNDLMDMLLRVKEMK